MLFPLVGYIGFTHYDKSIISKGITYYVKVLKAAWLMVVAHGGQEGKKINVAALT